MKLKYREVCRQPYQNCHISAGFVDGHPVDSMYVRLKRTHHDKTTILMRPDEMAALAWCILGTLWSKEIGDLT